MQTFCGVVRLVDVAKHRESLWPNSFNPKLFDVELMESQHMTTVCPFQHLAFDSVFDAAELRKNFVARQQRKNKVLPQKNFCDAVVGVQAGQVVFWKKVKNNFKPYTNVY